MNQAVVNSQVSKKQKKTSDFINWGGKGNSFLDKMLRGLYVFLLFAIDFVMFIYSVNGRLVENGTPNQAIIVILGVLLVFSLVLVLIFSFARDLQSAICAICTMLMVVAFFYQFGQGDVDNFIEKWCDKHASWLSYFCLIPSPWMVGIFLGIIIFFLFRNSLALLFVTMVLLFSGLVGVQRNEFVKFPSTEYQKIKDFSALSDQAGRDNLIYFFIPKLPSYQLFNSVKEKEMRELSDMVIGFLADNSFELYPNAFVQKNDTMSNIIDILNQVDYTSESSRNRGFAEFVYYWNFVHNSSDAYSLERNELGSYLQGKGYKTSTYAMPGFNFCMLGDDFYTDRCVVKSDKSANLYDLRTTMEKNIYALLGEWIVSLKSKMLLSFAKMFVNMSQLKDYKILSENRRLSEEGSPEVFDTLLDDIKRDPDGHVYLVYVDLPSDMYIYDEYCNLKPRKDWVALKDNSLYSGGIDAKRKAYAEQTKCLFGKMQEFMNELEKTSKLQKTNIIVQGVSTIRELTGMSSDIYSNFVADSLVTLGIRRAHLPKFLINANICLASDFTKTFITHQNYCFSLDNTPKYDVDDKYSLKKNLISNSIIRSGLLRNSIGNFRDWYKRYKINSSSYQKKIQEREEVNMRQRNAEESVLSEPSGKSKNSENIFFPIEEPVIDNTERMLLQENSDAEDVNVSANEVATEDVKVKDETLSEAKEAQPVSADEVAIEENTVTQENPVEKHAADDIENQEAQDKTLPVINDENSLPEMPVDDKKSDETELDLF